MQWNDLINMFFIWMATISVYALAAWLCTHFPGPLGMIPALVYLYWLRGPWSSWAVLAAGLVLAQVLEHRATPPERAPGATVSQAASAHVGSVAMLAMLFGSMLGASLYAGLLGRHFPYPPEKTFAYLSYRMAARLVRVLALVVVTGLSVFFVFGRA